MSDTITTNGNIPSNDVAIPYEKFMEEHIQNKLEINNLKRERENYITKDYVDLQLKNLETNLEHKFDDKFDKIDEKFDKIDDKFDKIDDKFITLERKFDDKFTEVDKTLAKMDAKISQSMLQMMFGTISAIGIFMAILFFLLQHYK